MTDSARTMLWRGILRPVLILGAVLCVSAGGDFDWTKNDKTSFYYGTFPTGTNLHEHVLSWQ